MSTRSTPIKELFLTPEKLIFSPRAEKLSSPFSRNANSAAAHPIEKLERGTGFEPATTSLEGWCSATELPPHFAAADSSRHDSDDRRRGLLSNSGTRSRSLQDIGAPRERPARGTRFTTNDPRQLEMPSRNGQGGIRTPEGVSQQIYSLPPLAAWVPARFEAEGLGLQASASPLRPGAQGLDGAGGRTCTDNRLFTKQVLYC
jgi:hypothetical protein